MTRYYYCFHHSPPFHFAIETLGNVNGVQQLLSSKTTAALLVKLNYK